MIAPALPPILQAGTSTPTVAPPAAPGFDTILADRLPVAAAAPLGTMLDGLPPTEAPSPPLRHDPSMPLAARALPTQALPVDAVTPGGADMTSRPTPRSEDADTTDTESPADDRDVVTILAAHLPLPVPQVPVATPVAGTGNERDLPTPVSAVRRNGGAAFAAAEALEAVPKAAANPGNPVVVQERGAGPSRRAAGRSDVDRVDAGVSPTRPAPQTAAALPRPIVASPAPATAPIARPPVIQSQDRAAPDVDDPLATPEPRAGGPLHARVDPVSKPRAGDDAIPRQSPVEPPAPGRPPHREPAPAEPPAIPAGASGAASPPIVPPQPPSIARASAHIMPHPPATIGEPQAPDVMVTTATLGDVSATVTPRADGERIHVHFAVQHETTAALIAGGSVALDHAITAAGTTLDTLSVEVRGDRAATAGGGGAATDQRGAEHDPPRRSPLRTAAPPTRIAAAARRDRFA